jgi:ribosomal protein S18 acetylase RimI-like enzyme
MSRPTCPFELRRLEHDDAAIYRQLRLEALERHPEAFGASLEDERQMSIDDMADRLARSSVFGAFDEARLEGVAGWYRMSGDKLAHRGALWGMYVRPQARGRGVGKALVCRVIDDAQDIVEQLHLTVTAHNVTARRLYETTGFTTYGVEPRALKVGDEYVDEIMMVRRLRG